MEMVVRKHGGVKKSSVKFYWNGELKAGDTELEVTEEEISKLDDGTGAVKQLLLEDGFEETVITSVKNKQEKILSVELVEEERKQTYRLGESDIKQRKKMVMESRKGAIEEARQNAKERLKNKARAHKRGT